jgi:hypothetical protein
MFDAWPFVIKVLLMNRKFTPALFEKVIVSIYEHGEVLAEVPCVYWPDAGHNHYLMENLGLLTLSCYFPELKKSDAWRKYALQELERCARAQLTVDGGQIEGCPGYHSECVYFFYLAATRARNHNLSISAEFMERLKKAAEYSIYCTRPLGSQVLWGDSFLQQLHVHAAIYGNLLFGDVQSIVNVLRNYIGMAAIKEMAGDILLQIDCARSIERLLAEDWISDNVRELPLVNYQRELDQVMIRTGWDKDAHSVFFACRTPINNVHAHIDPMGFDYTALHHNIIADPGAYCYREDDQRRKYKSAKWHSTLLVNDEEPFKYISSWVYGPQKEGRITYSGEKEGVFYVEAIHMNYSPVIHNRFIAILDREFLVVLDKIDHLSDTDTIQLYYHLDSTNIAVASTNAFVCHIGNMDDALAVSCIFSDNLAGEVLDGTISEDVDVERPSKRICLRDRCADPVRVYASVFYPCKGRRAAKIGINSFQYDESGIGLEMIIDDACRRYCVKAAGGAL